MKFKRHINIEHGLKQINVVPLVNIVLLLLIFFILSSSFFLPSGLKMNLPIAVTSEIVKRDNIEIVLKEDGSLYLNQKQATLEGLKIFFKQIAKRNPSVLIKADKRVSLDGLVRIWDMARSEGILQVNIATN